MPTAVSRPWYTFCRAYQTIPPDERKKVYQCKAQRWQFDRIAELPRRIGKALEDHLAPLRCYVFVACAPDLPHVPRAILQDSRFAALQTFHQQQHRWPLPHEIRILAGQVEDRLTAAAADEATPAPATHPCMAAAFAVAVRSQDPELADLLDRFAKDRLLRALRR